MDPPLHAAVAFRRSQPASELIQTTFDMRLDRTKWRI